VPGFPVKKSIGLLLDPDKAEGDSLDKIIRIAEDCRTDYILAGGSLASKNIDDLISGIKTRSSIPVVLFPGNLLQLSMKSDIIMLLSLISGRNPEYLIGNHVIAAPFLKNSREKIVPVGYILVSCGNRTSVEYISQTEAIPADKTDIVVATAMAGEMLGMGMIYLEAGSGATSHVPVNVISSVRQNIRVPLVVGGGIRKTEEVENIFMSGADLIILGNGCEENPGFLKKACSVRDKLRNPLV
ncbi:MAG: phosphoglycerol geranylgeranyltransferase, partial [Chloroflexota bacterium]